MSTANSRDLGQQVPPPTTANRTVVPERGLEEARTYEMAAGGGSLAGAICGVAAIVLSIIGLATTGAIPPWMAGISTILVGIALLLQGGALGVRFSERSFGEFASRPFGFRGAGVETLGGIAVIVLGVLALVRVAPLILMPAAAIVFGASLLLACGAMSRMSSARFPADDAEGMAREAALAASGSQALVGVAVIVLGILALVGFVPLTLSLVAMLVSGAGMLLTGSASSVRTFGVLNR